MSQPNDINGDFRELWIQKAPAAGAIALAGYSHGDVQVLFVADASGQVRPLTLGPPDWSWNWSDPIAKHDSITGVAAYYHAGDGRHHCFIAEDTGSIWEVAFASLEAGSPTQEIWIGGRQDGARGIAGFSGSDGSQQLFVCGKDSLIHPLELSLATDWVWNWRDPVSTFHDQCVGVAAYFHPTDNAKHVFMGLATGDIWESVIAAGGAWSENWLGIQDGGTSSFAGHSATNGTQHLFGAGATGWVLPLQIGPPHWKWRWDKRLMARHNGIVGLVSYFHPLDKVQHVFAALDSGDIWESRFQLRDQVATREWNPIDFPISYWNEPDIADLQTRYQQVAAAGFTFAMPTNAGGSFDDNRALLAAAGATGLKMLLKDDFVQSLRTSPIAIEDQQKLQTVVDTYSGHSAFDGYQLIGHNGTDEFFLNDFAVNADLIAFFRTKDPGHRCFIDILPTYADSTLYSPLSYKEYVESCVAQVKPSVLVFHNYSLQSTFPGSLYDNLRIVRNAAFAHVPFGQFLSSDDFGLGRMPTEPEYRRQAMQLLAFGGKEILWFTYFPVMVDNDGNTTDAYSAIANVNKDIQAIGRVLLRAENIGIYEIYDGVDPNLSPPAELIVTPLNADDLTLGIFSTSPVPESSSANIFYIMAANRRVDEIRLFTLSFRALSLQQLDRDAEVFKPVTTATDFGSHIEYEFSIPAGDAQLFRVFSPVGPFN